MKKPRFTQQKHILLAAAGSFTILTTLMKYWIESAGVIRANSFGYIQATVLIIGLLMISSALILWPGARSKQYHYLSYFFMVLFLILICQRLPALLQQAQEADDMYGGTIATIGDDLEYQVLAVNMLYGQGFSPAFVLPLETYHLDLSSEWGQKLKTLYAAHDPLLNYENDYFFRPPGLPMMMTAIYRVFGNQTLPQRQTMAVLTCITGLLLVYLGYITAGGLGTLMGGLAGLYHVYFYPGIYNFEFVMTEIPAALLIVLFCILMTRYLQNHRTVYFYSAAFFLSLLILLRPNLLMAVPFLLGILYLKKVGIKPLAGFTLVLALPIAAWSLYGTISLGRLVPITTQGDTLFPEFNNIQVLEGIGPEHSGQGAWHRGSIYDEDGNLIDNLFDTEPGENGLLKGLNFWFTNFEELPRLFYVKLRRGFFYDNSWSINMMHPEGIYILGLAYLLMAVGFRKPQGKVCVLRKFDSGHILFIQLGLISLMMLIWNQVAFWLTCILWLLILLLSLLRPYGDVYEPPFQTPVWLLSFVISHAIVTMMYAGYRYHWPLDAALILYCFLGIFTTLHELIQRKFIAAVGFFLVIFTTLGIHYVFI